jgi:hypothetical protein
MVFELLRFFALLVEKKCPEDCAISLRIAIQLSGSIVISLVVTSIIISFYFTKLVGFSSYGDWLSVFDTIFVLTSILYCMIYFSFFYLNRINKSQLEQESILSQRAEIELNTYKNKINPEFLYDSLETLIGLSKKDVDKADQFILKLSDIYRNILSTKKTELNTISNEIDVLNNLIQIVDHKFQGNLMLKVSSDVQKSSRYIVTGTFIIIIEDIINRSIISNIQNLKVTIEIKDGYLKISHPSQNKLIQIFSKKTELKQLEQANLQYGERCFFIDDMDNIKTYNIPIFEMEN